MARKPVDRFKADEGGNVAVIFALALLPLMAAAGSAVDYARAFQTRVHLQAAADSTALAMAREVPKRSPAEVASMAQAYFSAQFTGDGDVTPAPITLFQDGEYLRVTARAEVRTAIMGLFQIPQLPVAAVAESRFERRRVELALVLDNTGSMADNLGGTRKIDALRTASHGLVKTMEKAAYEPGAVRIAVVPFNSKVNVGTPNASAPWLRFDPAASNPALRMDKASWGGCVTDRVTYGNLDASDAPRDPADPDSLHLATSCGEVMPWGWEIQPVAAIRPLTSDFKAVHGTIDAMGTGGYTNLTIGLAWGMDALSPGGPLAGAGGSSKSLDKILVLLTDGDNTKNRESAFDDRIAIDKRTKLACGAAKAAGYQVFTIGVGVKDTALLKSCAANGGIFFEVTDATKLGSVFQAIADKITSLRLTS